MNASHQVKLSYNLPCRSKVLAAGLTLDKLSLQDIGLPEGAVALGIKHLVLTNPRWEDLRIAMSPTFSPDLKVSTLLSFLKTSSFLGPICIDGLHTHSC